MSKLRDPLRFAAFVEGASHLRDEEILHYDSSKNSDDMEESDISLNDESEDEEECNKLPPRAKTFYNEHITTNSVGDISEDEDEPDEEDNNYRRRAAQSRAHISQPSTSANASLSKQRAINATGVLKARQTHTPKQYSQRNYDNKG